MELVKLVLLGAPGVGKTSIVQQFVWNDFSDEYVPTERKHTYYPSVIINDRLYELKISDIPVIPYFPVNSFYEWTDYRFYGLRSATAYVLVFDLANADTFQYIRALREQMVESRDMRNVPLLVVGNKQDLIVAAESSTNGSNVLGGGSAGGSSGPYALCTPGGCSGGPGGAGPSGAGGGSYALCPVSGGSSGGGGGSSAGAGAISWGGTADFRDKRRDIVNLVKKNWKCGYVECSAKYNWRVVAVFKELMRAVDALETVPPGKDAWSPMTDNLHGALDRNRCVLL